MSSTLSHSYMLCNHLSIPTTLKGYMCLISVRPTSIGILFKRDSEVMPDEGKSVWTKPQRRSAVHSPHYGDHFVNAPRKWETMFYCNVVSHWLGTYTKWSKQIKIKMVDEVWYTGPICFTWWRHQMVAFSALLAICAGNSPATGEFPAQRPVTRSFDVFFDLRLNEQLSKQWWGWYLRRHRAHYDVRVMVLHFS